MMTDDMINLHSLVEKALTRICCGTSLASQDLTLAVGGEGFSNKNIYRT